MSKTITLPIDGVQYPFLFDKHVAVDSEMDDILRDLVAEIGPLKRSIDSSAASDNDDAKICFNRSQASVIASVRDGFAQDEVLSSVQVSALSTLFVGLMEFSNNRETPIASDPGALNNQYVRAVTCEGFSYVVRMPGDDEECGDVLFVSNDDNSNGVDWLDFILQLIIGVISVIFALSAGGKAIGKIIRKIRVSKLFESLKNRLRSSSFRTKLRKLVDVLPKGKRIGEIYDALKAVLDDILENVLRPNIGAIKDALSGIINAWTVTWSILSWILRFFSGGAALVAELGLLVASLTIKVLA